MGYKHSEINVFLKLGTTVGILSTLTIAWLFLAKVDTIAETSGKIIPEGKNQIISVLETSSIEKVLVKEGDLVKKGQQVALLDNVQFTANYQQTLNEIELSNLRLRATNALLNNSTFTKIPTDNIDKYIQIESEFNSRKLSYESSVLGIQSESSQVYNEILSNRANINKLESSRSSWELQLQSYKKLKETGFASNLMADEKIREAKEKIEEISIQKQLINASESKLKQSQFKAELAKNDFKQSLLKEKTELTQKLEVLKQEMVKNKHNINLKILTSPIDGIVKEITTNSPHAVISEGSTLMTVVPKDDNLKAEVLLKNTDIGFIEKGQKVKLKLETYSFQKYGLVEGKVEHISPDSTEDKDTRQNFYKVIIGLDKNYLEKNNTKYYIKSGMTVSADIIINQRNIFEYLTSPLHKTLLESGHER